LNRQDFLHDIDGAVRNVYRHDHDLLDLQANERALAHRLAFYLELVFKGYNIDCEYNRYGDELSPKTIPGIKICKESKHPTDSIVPDILIHIRKSKDKDNLAAFEIKLNDPLTECDHLKLRGLTSPREKYKYEFGIGLEFYANHCARLLYVAGRPVGKFQPIQLEQL
jgi:hypothetical protein